MQIDRPFRLLTTAVDGDVLAVLARADAEFTPPEVQELIGEYSAEGVRKALRRLVEQGIVLDRRAGNARLYRLNRAHLGAAAVMVIAELRSELLSRLRERINGWPVAPAFAALFGSAARGQMRTGSDVDLFVVRRPGVDPDDERWREQMETMAAEVTAWTGNDARVLEYSTEDVTSGLATKDPVLVDIKTAGVPLVGPTGYLNGRGRGA